MLYLLGWLWTFRFGDRAGLQGTKAEGAAMLIVAATVLAFILALPLVGGTKQPHSDPAVRSQLRRGVSIHAAALVLAFGYGLFYRDASYLVTLARYDQARRSASAEDAALYEEVARRSGGAIRR